MCAHGTSIPSDSFLFIYFSHHHASIKALLLVCFLGRRDPFVIHTPVLHSNPLLAIPVMFALPSIFVCLFLSLLSG